MVVDKFPYQTSLGVSFLWLKSNEGSQIGWRFLGSTETGQGRQPAFERIAKNLFAKGIKQTAVIAMKISERAIRVL